MQKSFSTKYANLYKNAFLNILSAFKEPFQHITTNAQGIGKELGLEPLYYHLHFNGPMDKLYTSVFNDSDFYHPVGLNLSSFFDTQSTLHEDIEFICSTTSLMFKYQGYTYCITDVYPNEDYTLSLDKLRLLKLNSFLASCDNVPNFTEVFMSPKEAHELLKQLQKIYSFINNDLLREWG